MNGAAATLRNAIRTHVRKQPSTLALPPKTEEIAMHQIIYIVGAIVIVIALLGFLGLR